MFMIYTPTDETAVATVPEVIAALHSYPFQLEHDFFAIGRGELEYLEIFKEDDAYSLSHIAEGSDVATPVAQGLPFMFVERAAALFCRADPGWRSLLEQSQLRAASSPDWTSRPAQASRPAPVPQGQYDAFHQAAPPIQPQAFGCLPFPLLALIGVLLLLGMAAAMFYSTGAK
jgi:hypothetical protein